MWREVCEAAAADSGAGRAVLDAAGSLQVVYCQSWPYDDPAGRLAEVLKIEPAHRLYSGIGGTTPQVLVQHIARSMLAGDLDLAIITGAEALETVRQAKKAGERLAWSHRDPEKKPFPFEAPFHPAEVAHGVFQAWLTFTVFDIARRSRLGVPPADYRELLGMLMAPLTEVAARNPEAWFRTARSARELTDATVANRMVAYPYTKYMVSVMDVDMAAALVLATHEAADRLGVPAERRVYLRGWCYATDPVYLAEHRDLAASPAMSVAGAEALSAAGVGIDDIAHFDLYSCFPSSLHLACDALGIAPDDRRSLTVTGGLPFFGGPGSNYMTHSLAAMVGVLRGDPGSFGMVSGVGMHMTKHVFGVYSSTPPERPVAPPDEQQVQAALDHDGTIAIADRHQGPATVATYTVVHARSGEPEWGLAICDLPDGRRAYARVEDRDLLTEIEHREWVGAEVTLAAGAGETNVVGAA